jgi:hypothetical protein
MLRKLSRHMRQNAVAWLALFVALGGTGAYAANTIRSSDIVDNEVNSADVKDQSLNTFDVHSFIGEDVIDNTLTGADINESTLATVPSSVLGGLGRMGVRQNGQAGPGFCDPESATFINCDIVATITLSRPARLLVIGSVQAAADTGVNVGQGACEVGTTSGPIPGTRTIINAGGDFLETAYVSLAGVSAVFPAGQHSFGIDCNETATFQILQSRVSAVALSDG